MRQEIVEQIKLLYCFAPVMHVLAYKGHSLPGFLNGGAGIFATRYFSA